MIVVFDAQCLLCNGWVHFLLKHDHRGVFQFASIQGETGRALLDKAGLSVAGLQTLLLVDTRRPYFGFCMVLAGRGARHGWGGLCRLPCGMLRTAGSPAIGTGFLGGRRFA